MGRGSEGLPADRPHDGRPLLPPVARRRAAHLVLRGGRPGGRVARLRCLSGGHVHELLDSAERWTFPAAWACPACSQSIAEVVYGVSERGGKADWLAVAVRCVECGDVAGVCDLVLPSLDLDLLLGAL